uniref:Vascular endothelial growth factor A-like n=1 Tax=Sinocyclocheilus rhinocerous TaxID=307959 RepID=A0A673HSR7_9TELE
HERCHGATTTAWSCVVWHGLSAALIVHPHNQNIGHKSVQAWKLYVSSLCKPRERLVQVEHEFPEVIHRGVFPSCVLLQRCGGCCSDEAMLCVNVSTHTTVMQFKQLKNVRGQNVEEIIELPFVEHSQCQCRFRDQL